MLRILPAMYRRLPPLCLLSPRVRSLLPPTLRAETSIRLQLPAARRSPSLTASALRSSTPSTSTCPPRALPPPPVLLSPCPPPFTASWVLASTLYKRRRPIITFCKSSIDSLLGGGLPVCETTDLAGPPRRRQNPALDAAPRRRLSFPFLGGVSSRALTSTQRGHSAQRA